MTQFITCMIKEQVSSPILVSDPYKCNINQINSSFTQDTLDKLPKENTCADWFKIVFL